MKPGTNPFQVHESVKFIHFICGISKRKGTTAELVAQSLRRVS